MPSKNSIPTTTGGSYVTRSRKSLGAFALVAGLGLIAAACSSDAKTATTTKAGDTTTTGVTTTTLGTTTTAAPVGKKGGTVTVGAEQEPDCMDWMGACGGSSWGSWEVGYNTMPRAYDVVKDGEAYSYKPSAMLASEPTAAVVGGKQTITYVISPKAVWSDGKPMTSADFKYTWEQVTTGKDIYGTDGYIDIEGVDASKPDTAVVTFKADKPYAPWRSLFGSGYGIFPEHLLAGKDRDAEMKDGYTWSGGPWKLEKWDKGNTITLVPNTAYFGDKPFLDKVVFKILADTAAEFKAFQNGEVDAIYPQPQLATVEAIKAGGLDGQQLVTANTGNLEALWMNNVKAPFDTVKFRQAFAYAIDRDAIVKALFGGIGVDKAAQSLNPPILAAVSDPSGYSAYTKDLKKVDALMTADGWAKGSDGIWAKGGNKASFSLQSTAGNKRRELTEQVLQAQLKEAGFDMTIDNHKAGDLFGKILPAGDFQLALYAQVATSIDPGNCTIMCSKNIPTAANKNTGNNWTRTTVTGLDPLLEAVDYNTDLAKVTDSSKKADLLMAENMVSLPLDPLPNIGLISSKIKSGVSDNAIYSIFGSLNHWSL